MCGFSCGAHALTHSLAESSRAGEQLPCSINHYFSILMPLSGAVSAPSFAHAKHAQPSHSRAPEQQRAAAHWPISEAL